MMAKMVLAITKLASEINYRDDGENGVDYRLTKLASGANYGDDGEDFADCS